MSRYAEAGSGETENGNGNRWRVGLVRGRLVVMWGRLTMTPTDQEAFAGAVARAVTPGQPNRRACCDHCNNLEGDPDGHDYTLDGPHDGPCEQCAAEQARREHDEGTG